MNEVHVLSDQKVSTINLWKQRYLLREMGGSSHLEGACAHTHFFHWSCYCWTHLSITISGISNSCSIAVFVCFHVFKFFSFQGSLHLCYRKKSQRDIHVEWWPCLTCGILCFHKNCHISWAEHAAPLDMLSWQISYSLNSHFHGHLKYCMMETLANQNAGQ